MGKRERTEKQQLRKKNVLSGSRKPDTDGGGNLDRGTESGNKMGLQWRFRVENDYLGRPFIPSVLHHGSTLISAIWVVGGGMHQKVLCVLLSETSDQPEIL